MSEPRYQHRQVGVLMIVVLAIVMVLFIVAAAGAGFHPVMLVTGVLVAVILSAFTSLTVTVDREFVTVRFGWGFPRFSYALADIRSATKVRNSWIYGWGIRLMAGGWIFSVSGLDAVEIVLADGRKRRIGTDDPAGLESAIRRAMDAQGRGNRA